MFIFTALEQTDAKTYNGCPLSDSRPVSTYTPFLAEVQVDVIGQPPR